MINFKCLYKHDLITESFPVDKMTLLHNYINKDINIGDSPCTISNMNIHVHGSYDISII